MKNILRYFIQGLIITVPVAITGYVIFRLILFIGSFFCKQIAAQSGGSAYVPVIVINNDSFPILTLPEVYVVSKRTFASSYEQNKFNSLMKNCAGDWSSRCRLVCCSVGTLKMG